MISTIEEFRDRQSAALRCSDLLHELEEIYPRFATEAEPESTFGRVVFDSLWEEKLGPADGDALLESLSADADSLIAQSDECARAIMAIFVAAAFCVQGIKADQAGDRDRAWGYAFDAAHWTGFLSGLVEALPDGAEPATAAELVEKQIRSKVESLSLKPPERDDGLALALYETLKEAHVAGRRKPTVQEILQTWKISKPATIESADLDGASFFTAGGDKIKTVSPERLRDRIKRMTATGRKFSGR